MQNHSLSIFSCNIPLQICICVCRIAVDFSTPMQQKLKQTPKTLHHSLHDSVSIENRFSFGLIFAHLTINHTRTNSPFSLFSRFSGRILPFPHGWVVPVACKNDFRWRSFWPTLKFHQISLFDENFGAALELQSTPFYHTCNNC